jgi:hypothetical protein
VKWNLVFMFLSLLVLWCRSWFTWQLYVKNRLIFFRATEQTLTRFGRTFPNEMWHSSHMTSDVSVISWWSVLLVEKTTDLPQVTGKLLNNVWAGFER